MQDIDTFKNLIQNSKRILITSHISPDPDAISSVLLLGRTLKTNFNDKEIQMVLEEKPARDLSFLAGFDEIQFMNLLDTVRQFRPDLFIMVDAMNFDRISRNDADQMRATVRGGGLKRAIIDHHTEVGLETNDLYINNQLPATAQEIYDLLFKKLGMEKPAGWAETALLGIITDSARFKYDNPKHRETFQIVSELLDEGASIERLENRLDRYTKDQMSVFASLANNIVDSGKGYTYSFIDKNPDDKLAEDQSYKMACELFTSQFIRNIGSNQWGFIVYPEIVEGKTTFSVSFRSVSGLKDVAAIAGKLGGGGHKQVAGAKGIKAANVKEAVQKVQQAITSS